MHADNENINEVDFELAKRKTGSLIGRYGFTATDRDDLEQEMLLEIYKTRQKVEEYLKKEEASRETIVSRILDNRICEIIKKAKTDKRCVHLPKNMTSMDEPIYHNGNNEAVTVADLMSEDGSIQPHRLPDEYTATDLNIDFSLMSQNLSALHVRILRLTLAGHSKTDMAKMLRMKRTTFNREIERVRKALLKQGFSL